ncbi:MAG: hypothetical protein K2P33_02200 [Acutalibacter sp.]|nr:hypothetical protein [Acutalibacter sp.]
MIEMICGAYGAKGRLIRPSDGPFTLSAEEERRLVERGVARYVREYMEPMLPETLNFKMEYEGNPKGEAGPTTLTPPLSGPEESGGDPLTPEGSAESEPFSREELDDMTKDSLLKVAAQLRLGANARMSKADVLQVIHNALSQGDEPTPPDLTPEDPVE